MGMCIACCRRVARQITDELLTSKVPMLARLLPHSAGESVIARAANLQAAWALQDARERFSQLPTQLGGAPRRSIIPPLYLLQRLVASSRPYLGDSRTPSTGAATPYILLSVDGLLVDAVKIDASGATPLAIRYPPDAVPLGPSVLHASYGVALSKAFSFMNRSGRRPPDVPMAYLFPSPFPSPCGGEKDRKNDRPRRHKLQQQQQQREQEQQQELQEQEEHQEEQPQHQKACAERGHCPASDPLPLLPKYHNPFKGCTGPPLMKTGWTLHGERYSLAAGVAAVEGLGPSVADESMSDPVLLHEGDNAEVEQEIEGPYQDLDDGHVPPDVARLQALMDDEDRAEAEAAAAVAASPQSGSTQRKLHALKNEGEGERIEEAETLAAGTGGGGTKAQPFACRYVAAATRRLAETAGDAQKPRGRSTVIVLG